MPKGSYQETERKNNSIDFCIGGAGGREKIFSKRLSLDRIGLCVVLWLWLKVGEVVFKVVYRISLACCMFMSWIGPYRIYDSLYIASSCL